MEVLLTHNTSTVPFRNLDETEFDGMPAWYIRGVEKIEANSSRYAGLTIFLGNGIEFDVPVDSILAVYP